MSVFNVAVTLVCCLAVSPAYAGDWTDGFNGSVGNWSRRSGTAMTYSTAHNHATYTGAGCMAHPTASSEMYRSTGSRPYHAGIATAYHYDSVRWRAGVCGNQYRQLLGFAASDYSIYQLAVGHYSAGDAANFYRRDSGGSYTSIGAKGARTTCAGGWIYFVVQCQADGDVYRRADDGVVNRTHTRARNATEINAGIGMVTIGLGASSANTGYWDDITWDGYDPGIPTGIAATANSTSQITWTANAASDNNHYGFALMNGGSEEEVSSTTTRATSASFVRTGLSANTAYTRGIRAWNGDNNSGTATAITRFTLQNTPTAPTFGTIAVDSVVLNTSGLNNPSAGSSGVYFDSTTAGGDGGINAWVAGTTDTATGLSANTEYTFQVMARNGDAVATGYSGTASKYTLIQTPAGVAFGTITLNSVDAAPSGTLNNLAAGSSGVRVSNTTASNDSGWEQDTSGYTSSGLVANTEYTFVARARNADGIETGDSTSVKAWTLSVPPGVGSVTPDISSPCVNSTVTWTAAGGFGAGKVQKYKYAWTQNAEHTWTGSETDWSTGTVQTEPTAAGTWYLHVKGYNGANVENGTAYYTVTGAPLSVGGTTSAAP